MTRSAAEQYMLELVNRARLDPAAEAARFGISLNEGLAAGTINTTAKQVLAPDDLLEDAAANHSLWMLATDTFSHTGIGNSSPGDRMVAAGYVFSGSWTWGENISWRGTQGTLDPVSAIAFQHQSLFLSPGHRTNILGGAFREIGIAQELGAFTSGGNTYNASMVTQNFAKSGSSVFLTGVAYSDSDNDDFYSIGEGVQDVSYAIGGNATLTAAAGGYALSTSAASGVSVTVTPQGGSASVVTVDLSAGNVKLDLVDGSLFRTSGNLTLVSGVANAGLLGIANLSLTGNSADNVLTGNRGANALFGNDGNDTISGGDQYDTIRGGNGNDRVWGGNGRDLAFLGNGNDIFWDNGQNNANGHDTIWAGNGNDTVNGGGGNEVIYGEAGNDSLLGGIGNDTINGGANYDTIRGGDGDDRVWGGNGRDLAFLGNGNDVFWDNGQNDVHGHDTIWGGNGNDTVNGGGGNEVIYGEAGNDSLLGGIGNDTINGGANYDTIRGGDGDDRVWGGNGRDLAFLGNGNDRYSDTTQNDVNGQDTVFGGAGNDTIHGGGGNDWLDGGTDNDVLTGGVGADSFVFGLGYDLDRVTDFADNVDTLVFDDALWGGGLSVAQVISTYGSIVGTDAVFDFGGGDVMTIAGVTNLSLFSDDILIV